MLADSPVASPYVEEIMSRAQGTVLDIGPGSGDQMFHFNKDRVDKIYAAEPNTFLHGPLMAKAKENGLGSRYVPLRAGVEASELLPALKRVRLLPESTTSLPPNGVFDSIVAVRSMCSATHSQSWETASTLWWLLKPGGELLFFEHLKNDDSTVIKAYARGLNLMWPALMGGCRLDGNLDKIVLRMHGWEKRNIQNVKEYEGYGVFRYAKGICTK